MAYTGPMADSITHFTYATTYGPVTIEATPRGLSRTAFSRMRLAGAYAASSLTNRAASQLQEYLAGKRLAFDLPFDMGGTPFQQQVWAAVADIPYGATATASELAQRLGRPGAHRSVGAALRQGPLVPFIPLHRVPTAAADTFHERLYEGLLKLEQRYRPC